MTPELAVRSRNATEEAILDAARQTLAEVPWERLTMDAIAKRAFVSRTAVYFYFDSKDAVVERLVQRAFHDIYEAAKANQRSLAPTHDVEPLHIE